MSLSAKKLSASPWEIVAVFVLIVLGYFGVSQVPTELERRVDAGEVYVYFVSGDDLHLLTVRRDMPAHQSTEALLKSAIEALVTGPTTAEKSAGMTSALNSKGVVVNSVRLADHVALIDFSNEFEHGVAGSARVQAIRNQIEKTAFGFPGVKQVRLTVDGREAVLEP